MPTNIHKGTELNNVRETWEKNEREHMNANAPSSKDEKLQKVIEEEATEYDDANKEERLLSGDRASLDDEDASGS